MLKLKEETENLRKGENGITLISLVVTIIVLLILSAIALSMLSGENSVLRRATQAKKVTGEAEFKEQLQLAVMASWDTFGKLDITTLKANVQRDTGATISDEDDDTITYSLNGMNYSIDKSNGNVAKAGPKIVATLTGTKIVNSAGTEVVANSTDPATTKLYIKFGVSVDQGTITSVTDSNGTAITATNEEYSYEISANGDYKFIVNATVDGENASGTTDTVSVSQFAVRAGIKVGDYVTYTAPTRLDYSLTAAVSGYGTESQTLGQEYTKWRVLNINDDGSMDLVAAVTSSNKKIHFRDAKGYNNAVYALHDMCKYLYENESKGITARSINYEDITKKLNDIDSNKGLGKIANYQTTEVGKLSANSNIESVDTTNNTVTYKRIYSYYPNYPDIYQYQIGAGIDNTTVLKAGDNVPNKEGQKAITESDKFYSEPTTNTHAQANNLTAKYTGYAGSMLESDFKDYDGSRSGTYKALFQTGTNYWLASRCVGCNSNDATFCLRRVFNNNLTAYGLFSLNGSGSGNDCICPLIFIPSNIQVTPCTGTNSDTNTHTVVTE